MSRTKPPRQLPALRNSTNVRPIAGRAPTSGGRGQGRGRGRGRGREQPSNTTLPSPPPSRSTTALVTPVLPVAAPSAAPASDNHLRAQLEDIISATRQLQSAALAATQRQVALHLETHNNPSDDKRAETLRVEISHEQALAKLRFEREYELERIRMQQAHELELAKFQAAERLKERSANDAIRGISLIQCEAEERKRKRQEEYEELEHQLRLTAMKQNAEQQRQIAEQQRVQTLDEAKFRRREEEERLARSQILQDQRHYEAMSFNRSYGNK